jgi:YggT family protein
MSDTIRTALLFLIETLFNIYLFILVIRIILVWVRADYFHPLTQFIVKLTDVLIKPLRKVLPNVRNFETASIVMVLAIEIIKFFLIACISFGFPNLFGIPILAIGDSIALVLQTFTYAILLQVILSFLHPMSPLMALVSRFNSPIMRPLQQVIPIIGGFDITPIPALIGLQLLNIILVAPLMTLGQNISFG